MYFRHVDFFLVVLNSLCCNVNTNPMFFLVFASIWFTLWQSAVAAVAAVSRVFFSESI